MNFKKPQNIPEKYDSFVFIKCYEEETYVNSMRDGKLYMRSKEVFAALDSIGRGDFLENKSLIALPTKSMCPVVEFKKINGSIQVVLSERIKNAEDDHGTIFMLHDRDAKRNKVFCLYTLWFDTTTGEIMPIDPKMMAEFGEYCCLIYNPVEFLNRVFADDTKDRNSCENTQCGFVKYTDIQNKTVNDWHPFEKNMNLFGHQNEFRLLTTTASEEESYTYDISNWGIKDISVKIKFAELDEKFHINNGMIMIHSSVLD